VDMGSSYLPSDMNAAYLFAQLEESEKINNDRLESWKYYYNNLNNLKELNKIELPFIPNKCEHNAHMFYIKVKNLEERTGLINHLKVNDILSVFHYIPLHSAPAGQKYGRFNGIDKYTTKESDRLIRLPMYFGLKMEELDKIISFVNDFYKK